jgi:hypothetical protein
MARLIGLLVFASWLATVVITNQFRRIRLIHVLVIAYVLWFGVSGIWSPNPNATSIQFKTYVQLALFYFIIWDLMLYKSDVEWGLQAFLFGACLAAVSAVRNFLIGQTYNPYQERYSSFVGSDPNTDGVIMAMVADTGIRDHAETSLAESAGLRLHSAGYICCPHYGQSNGAVGTRG